MGAAARCRQAAARQRRREARAEPPERAARAADAGDGVALLGNEVERSDERAARVCHQQSRDSEYLGWNS